MPAVLDTLRQSFPHAALDEAASVDMPVIYVGRQDVLDVCRRLQIGRAHV